MIGKQPTVIDNDEGEITVELDGRELRGWSYKNEDERRKKMLCAREYVEGWCDALDIYFPVPSDQQGQAHVSVLTTKGAALHLVLPVSSSDESKR